MPAAPYRAFEALDLRPVRRWLNSLTAGGLELVSHPTVEARDYYYDTPEWRFQRAGCVLRVRVADGRAEALLEPRPGGTAARVPTSRETVADARVETLLGAAGPIGERVRAVAGRSGLLVCFDIGSRRQRIRVRRGGVDLADVWLDDLALPVEEGERPARLSRVEIEADAAAEPEIERFVETLRESCNLRPALIPPYEASMLARGLAAPALPELGPREVDPALTSGQTAFAVLREQCFRWLTHEPGTRLGDDIEELHDMRVAVRRMRAAMRLFQEHLPVRTRRLRDELAWVGRSLGEVRDLDVHLAQLAEWRADLQPEDAPALDAVVQLLQKRRGVERKRMLRALDSKRYEHLVERTTRTLAAGPPQRGAGAGRTPITVIAPALIRGRFDRVIKPGNKIKSNSPEERYHRLRIRCKALRYALEFHRAIYGRPAQEMIRVLVRLQDVLGDHQDACVATAWLRDLVRKEGRRLPPPTLFVAGMLAQRYAREARKLRRKFREVYAALDGKRWKQLRRAMEVRTIAVAAPAREPDVPR